MAAETTTPDDEKIPTETRDRLAYLGQDQHARYHYYDRQADRVIVLDEAVDLYTPSDDILRHERITGEIEFVQPLADIEQDVADWIGFVRQDCGWLELAPGAVLTESWGAVSRSMVGGDDE